MNISDVMKMALFQKLLNMQSQHNGTELEKTTERPTRDPMIQSGAYRCGEVTSR